MPVENGTYIFGLTPGGSGLCHSPRVGSGVMTGSVVQTFRLVAKCSPAQRRRLIEVFGMCAEMYNALLESWKGSRCWWLEHHNPDLEKQPSVSKYDLYKLFTGVREDRADWAAVAFQVGRGVISRYDRAVRSFYDRCHKGDKPGFPRFKPRSRWRSVEIPDPTASMICPPGEGGNRSERWWRLRVKGRDLYLWVDGPGLCHSLPVRLVV